jgi:hypothetical protein
MKNILFVFAHYDDESYSAGTIKKLIEQGHQVYILIVCGNGAYLNDGRSTIFKENLKKFGSGCEGYSLKYFDLTLNDLMESVKNDIKKNISKFIEDKNIDEVYTNNGDDLHFDHEEVSQMVKIVCRPGSNQPVKKLYECYVAGAAEYGLEGICGFNHFTDISAYQSFKESILMSYSNYLKNGSSIKNAINVSEYMGGLYNMKFAEMFKLVWSKE